MKYRIIRNGEGYIAQKKIIFWWDIFHADGLRLAVHRLQAKIDMHNKRYRRYSILMLRFMLWLSNNNIVYRESSYESIGEIPD